MAKSPRPSPAPSTIAHRPTRRTRRRSAAWLFAIALAAMAAYSVWAVREPSFTATDDAAVQIAELKDHVKSTGGSARVVQVDLDAHPKVSQLDDIDSSPSGYGSTACGPIAAAVALGGDGWPALLARITAAAGEHYGAHTGIQPTHYAAALRRVFGWGNVKAVDRSTLGALYNALSDDRTVIVDLKVNEARVLPSDQRPNYAHFARVLGIDVEQGEFYIDNTLRGRPYWTVSLDDFMAAWHAPETTASIILDPGGVEAVDRWAVLIDRRWP